MKVYKLPNCITKFLYMNITKIYFLYYLCWLSFGSIDQLNYPIPPLEMKSQELQNWRNTYLLDYVLYITLSPITILALLRNTCKGNSICRDEKRDSLNFTSGWKNKTPNQNTSNRLANILLPPKHTVVSKLNQLRAFGNSDLIQSYFMDKDFVTKNW